MKASFRKYNNIHKECLRLLFNENYYAHKHKRQATFKKYYKNKEKRNATSKMYYGSHKSKAIAASHVQNLSLWNAKSVLRRARQCYAKHKAQYCAVMRHIYELTEPKPHVQHQYVQKLNKNYSAILRLWLC